MKLMKIQNNGWAMGDEIRNTNDDKVAVAKEEPVNGDMQSERMAGMSAEMGGRSLFPYIYG